MLGVLTLVFVGSFGMFLLGRLVERLYAREIMRRRTRHIQRALKPVNLYFKGDDLSA